MTDNEAILRLKTIAYSSQLRGDLQTAHQYDEAANAIESFLKGQEPLTVIAARVLARNIGHSATDSASSASKTDR